MIILCCEYAYVQTSRDRGVVCSKLEKMVDFSVLFQVSRHSKITLGALQLGSFAQCSRGEVLWTKVTGNQRNICRALFDALRSIDLYLEYSVCTRNKKSFFCVHLHAIFGNIFRLLMLANTVPIRQG